MLSNPEYAHWLYYVAEQNEPALPWMLPSTLNQDCFRPLLRALYLAGYGPGEARCFIDRLANPEIKKVTYDAKKLAEEQSAVYRGFSTEVDLSFEREL